MYFEVVGEITNIETIAAGSGIRDIERLQKRYGLGRWRKLKDGHSPQTERVLFAVNAWQGQNMGEIRG
jgi:hypothetical protein